MVIEAADWHSACVTKKLHHWHK